MNVVIQFSVEEELKALDILLRHSPGTILPNRTYIIDTSAAQALRDAGISYRHPEEVLIVERDVDTL